MDHSGAVEAVADRLRGLTEYQLAHVLVRAESNFHDHRFDWLDLTPRGDAGPIDVLGHFHSRCAGFHGRYAHAVCGWGDDDPVDRATVESVLSALDDRSVVVGNLATAGGYTDGAETAVEAYDGTATVYGPPTLADESEVAWLLVQVDRDDDRVESTGVARDDADPGEGTYETDEAFWTAIDRIGTDAVISRWRVPRADSLSAVGETAAAVDAGRRHHPAIGAALREAGHSLGLDLDRVGYHQDGGELSLRRVAYHTTAAWALELVAPDGIDRRDGRPYRRWTVTDTGREFLDRRRSDPRAAREFLTDRALDLAVVRAAVDRLRTGEGTHEEVRQVVREQTELSGARADRRAETIGRWFGQWTGPVDRVDPEDGDPRYVVD